MAEPWYLLFANEEIGDSLRIMVSGIAFDDPPNLVLRRTGPYVPAVSIAGMGHLIIREVVMPLFKNLSGVNGFRKVVKEKVVRVDWKPGSEWDTWGYREPESVIEDGKHDERLSDEIGELYEVLLETDGEVFSDYDQNGRIAAMFDARPTKDFELFGGLTRGGYQDIVATAKFLSKLTGDHRQWLQIVPIGQ